jgi:hypothetical protein
MIRDIIEWLLWLIFIAMILYLAFDYAYAVRLTP